MASLSSALPTASLMLLLAAGDASVPFWRYLPPEQVLQQKLAPEEMTLSVELQVVILLKALPYDLSHEKDFRQTGYRIGIVYAPEEPSSLETSANVAQRLSKYSGNPPLSNFVIPFTGIEQFRESIVSNGINVVYVCPGMTRNLAAIVEVSRQQHVTTITGIERYVREGIALGLFTVEVKGAKVPKVSVNMNSAKFDASFLDMVFKIYR